MTLLFEKVYCADNAQKFSKQVVTIPRFHVRFCQSRNLVYLLYLYPRLYTELK